MIHEMTEPQDEKTRPAAATAPDTTGDPKEGGKDYDPYCCTPPDENPGPIGG